MRPLSSKSRNSTLCPVSVLSTTMALNAPIRLSPEISGGCGADEPVGQDGQGRPRPKRLPPDGASALLLRHGDRASDGAFDGRQVDQARCEAERHGQPPHEGVVAIDLVQDASEPDAQET